MTHYLDIATEAKLKEVAERELIAKHMRTLAEMQHSGVVTVNTRRTAIHQIV